MLARRTLLRLTAALSLIGLALVPAAAHAQAKKEFKLAWSIYVGWVPWQWAEDNGIVKKWADKYGIKIDVVQFNDYVESINQYTAGSFDALTVTNMDALSIPGTAGVDTTAVIVGDFSNGNDAVILKGKDSLAALKGQKVNLVEFSVSHYLLARALESAKLTERDVTVVNTSDADLVAAWGTKDVTAVVTWNPLVSTILGNKDAKSVFDSSKIPGEIMDLLVANTAVLKDNPDFGKALVGIWYETMAVMSADTPAGKAAREAMGKATGTDLAGFDAQLKTTRMFYTPTDALAFVRSGDPKTTMTRIATFLYDHGLLGQGAPNAEAVGMAFADGSTWGNPKFVKLRFTDQWMALAAEGKL